MSQQLENIYVSLEIAKQLKEAGYPQESLFYWVYSPMFRDWMIAPKESTVINHEEEPGPISYVVYAAPTASEIGEKLPLSVYAGIKKRSFFLRIYKAGDILWQVGYFDLETNLLHDEFGNTLVEAMAKIWLYLKKENLSCHK